MSNFEEIQDRGSEVLVTVEIQSGRRSRRSPFMSEVKRIAMEVLESNFSAGDSPLLSAGEEFVPPSGVESVQTRLVLLREQLKGGNRASNKELMGRVQNDDPELYRAYFGLDALDAIDRQADAKDAALQLMDSIGRKAEQNLMDSLAVGQDLDNKDAA